MSAFAEKNHRKRLQNNPEIHPQGHIADIVKIQYHHLFKGHRTSSQCLPQSSTPWKAIESVPVPVLIALPLVIQAGPGTHQGHVPFDHIKKLREFINAGFTDKFSELKNPGVIRDLKHLDVLAVALTVLFNEILNIMFMS